MDSALEASNQGGKARDENAGSLHFGRKGHIDDLAGAPVAVRTGNITGQHDRVGGKLALEEDFRS
jgi:hypothetical protein